jgi:lipopolysaccharide biosynthesis glycosyltransferase
MLRVFIGYDAHETVAFHVAAFSIMRRASAPVSITGLMLPQLPITRDRDPKQSTDFAFSRFLVPHLCHYEGRAIFMDCDMLCRSDILELWDSLPPFKSAAVVKHDYAPKAGEKFLDQAQTAYRRKNWSSVMVFNNPACRALTPAYVNTASGLDLHQFRWLEDAQLWELPREWNHLVGEYEPNPAAKLVHFTLGTPCFAKYRHCEYSKEWHEERAAMLDYDRSKEYSRPERVDA